MLERRRRRAVKDTHARTRRGDDSHANVLPEWLSTFWLRSADHRRSSASGGFTERRADGA